MESWNPVASFVEGWRFGLRSREAWLAGAAGAARIAALQRERLGATIAHAREHSPLYRRLWSGLPAGVPALQSLPRVTRAQLMADFDDWVTDPRVKLADALALVADPRRIAQPLLGRYVVWTSSGSTGRPGIYLQDDEALAIYDALLATRFSGPRGAASPLAATAAGGRFAMVAATGGHFAGVVSWERLRRLYPWLRATMRSYSVLAPLPELVRELNAQPPGVLAAYPTTLLLLAQERAAGRLRIAPDVLWSGGETLAAAERVEIERAFGCALVDGYGASEFLNIAFDCGHGSLHVNSDWVVLEPIDDAGRPVPAGRASASVLLTSLANRVQPLVRYDLGDSVTFRRAPCACGSPFPAIEVDGRRDDIVTLRAAGGATVSLPPLALATVVEEGARVHRFQLVQDGPARLRVRFETPPGDRRDPAWRRIVSSLREYLARHGLVGVELTLDSCPPMADPVSGKLREVIVCRRARGGTRAPGIVTPRRRARPCARTGGEER